jgi:hypothetical protein
VSPVAFAKQGRYMIEVHAIAGGPSTALDTMQLDVVRTESSVDMEVKGGSLINVPVPWLPIASKARAVLTVRDLTRTLPLIGLKVSTSDAAVTVIPKVINSEAGEVTFDLMIKSDKRLSQQYVTLNAVLRGVDIGQTVITLDYEHRAFRQILFSALLVGGACFSSMRLWPAPCVAPLKKRKGELQAAMEKTLPQTGVASDWGERMKSEIERYMVDVDRHLSRGKDADAAICIDNAERHYYDGLAERARTLGKQLRAIQAKFSRDKLDAHRMTIDRIEYQLFHGQVEEAFFDLSRFPAVEQKDIKPDPIYRIEFSDLNDLWAGSHVLFRVVRDRSGPIDGSAEWTYSDGRSIRNPARREVRSLRHPGMYSVMATFGTERTTVVEHVGVKPPKAHDRIPRWVIYSAWKSALVAALSTAALLLVLHYWFAIEGLVLVSTVCLCTVLAVAYARCRRHFKSSASWRLSPWSPLKPRTKKPVQQATR